MSAIATQTMWNRVILEELILGVHSSDQRFIFSIGNRRAEEDNLEDSLKMYRKE